ncbi:MAG: sigma-70 family RNA polymerase sigma factor [Nannocystaceae bacterium]|nr:sigma-70 family RNA polymerase sigma factor [Myxococcales bacterium]
MDAARDESALIEAARAGDRRAFDDLVAPQVPRLRAFLYRLVCQPEDAADLTQEALLTAYQRLDGFRGDSSFRTWLFAIGARKGLDLLRKRKRWPLDAQARGEQATLATPRVRGQLDALVSAAEYQYEYRQHVAYCLGCVARTLPPEQSAALLLTELLLLEARDAAKILDMSASTYRHRLSAARAHMRAVYEGMCALVGKQGVCYQCAKLREYIPEGHRGRPVEPIADDDERPDRKLTRRLAVIRDLDLDVGQSPVHDLLYRYMSELWSPPPT